LRYEWVTDAWPPRSCRELANSNSKVECLRNGAMKAAPASTHLLSVAHLRPAQFATSTTTAHRAIYDVSTEDGHTRRVLDLLFLGAAPRETFA
jgi:hypothetical protein